MRRRPVAPSLTPEAIAPLTDAELLQAAVERVRRPAAEIRSFALHAPLELLARAALLVHVPPAQRELTRLQLATTALHYESTTPFLPVPDAESATTSGDADAQLEALRSCLAEGDMAGSARATGLLARALPMHRLAAARSTRVWPRSSARSPGTGVPRPRRSAPSSA